MRNFPFYWAGLCFLLIFGSAKGQSTTETRLLWEGNVLVLKTVTGKVVAEYSNKLGRPECWENALPQRVMLFYRAYQRIELLDHHLNRMGDAIFLPDVGIFQAHLACLSAQNGVWIYDQIERRVHFVDYKLNKRTSTLEINAALSTVQGHPKDMKEEGGRLILHYPHVSVVIDRYGNFIKLIQNK